MIGCCSPTQQQRVLFVGSCSWAREHTQSSSQLCYGASKGAAGLAGGCSSRLLMPGEAPDMCQICAPTCPCWRRPARPAAPCRTLCRLLRLQQRLCCDNREPARRGQREFSFVPSHQGLSVPLHRPRTCIDPRSIPCTRSEHSPHELAVFRQGEKKVALLHRPIGLRTLTPVDGAGAG